MNRLYRQKHRISVNAVLVSQNITSWSTVCCETLIVSKLMKKFAAFYVIPGFLTMSLSWARWVQLISSHPVSLSCILILSYSLSLSFRFLHQNPAFLCSPMDAICCAYQILLYMINLVIFSEQYKSWSSLLFNFVFLPVAMSFLGPSIFLATCPWTPSASVPP